MTILPWGRAVAWIMLAIAIVANILGYTSSLYQQWWWFDRVLHGYTLWAGTLWLGVFVFAPVIRPEHARSLRAFLVILAVGVAVGALWEIAEWAFDQFASGDVIKGKQDTILDIIMDTLGALLAAAMTMASVDRRDHPRI